MTRAAAAGALAVVVGFLVGLAWGRGTRDALSDATQVSFEGGILTTRTDTTQALRAGLDSLLR